MTETSLLPAFADVQDILTTAKSTLHPSELHGLLCGHIAATRGKPDSAFKKKLLGKNKNPALQALLQELLEMSYHQMSEFSFEFTLLLPADDSDINTRTEALGLFCQGFLTGLHEAGVPVQNREASDLTETLQDLTEIARVNYGDIADNEEDETAWFDLAEYVRLGVLMVFQELSPGQMTGENDTLH